MCHSTIEVACSQNYHVKIREMYQYWIHTDSSTTAAERGGERLTFWYGTQNHNLAHHLSTYKQHQAIRARPQTVHPILSKHSQ